MVEREIQTIEEIPVEALPAEVDSLKLDRWRLVQILCVAAGEGYELSYSFGGGYAMRTLRIKVGAKDPIPSITPYFGAAFLYENEIRDLFGARIERIDPDWEGDLIGAATGKPFSRTSLPLESSERPSYAATPRPADPNGGMTR